MYFNSKEAGIKKCRFLGEVISGDKFMIIK